MASHGLRIDGLYKIFGPREREKLELVRNGISKSELNRLHRHVLALKDINIDIPGGGISVVMGLSGSGKSTLIRHINRLIAPSAGRILYDGVDICRMEQKDLRAFRRQRTAMVFQKFALLPHRTVLDNVLYGLDIQRVARSQSRSRGLYWIERVGLAGFEQHYPNQLSGGMQQRVGLARALANDADILLMDEAYSALDPLIRVDMQSMLIELQAELKKTIVFITHDLDEALRLGDRIVILRDGEIVQQGSGQEIVLAPADDYIAAFVREVNRGRVIEARAVMRPLEGEASGMRLSAGIKLEAAAKKMAEADERHAIVIDDDGAPIGVIDSQSILSAMVAPQDDGRDQAAPARSFQAIPVLPAQKKRHFLSRVSARRIKSRKLPR